MSEKITLNVYSEIGNLKAVFVHKPGKELEKLTPDLLGALLFDDIPWLKKMREEHDAFAYVLRANGASVYYVEEMLAQTLEDCELREAFVSDLLDGARIGNERLYEELKAFINSKTPAEIAEIAISGLLKDEAAEVRFEKNIWDYVNSDYPLYIDPVPNLYFMRDPAATIGDGMSINHMNTETRRRESKIIGFIYDHHPAFIGEKKLWYENSLPGNIEGGDILVLSKELIALGCSQRTSTIAIESIAKKLFKSGGFKQILVIQIPPVRAFMHLDTVCTMVDYDKFTIYPGIENSMQVYSLTPGANESVRVSPEPDLVTALKSALGLPAVKLIQSGGGDALTAAREQWNDSTNTLAIAPGKVVTYMRNERSNETLEKAGVEVLAIGGSELVRGRGGPRCMSCPLTREDI